MIQEYNTVQKNPKKVELRFASCYPNIYKSAMSSLGYQIIYDYLNTREDIYCERVIYPQTKSIETRSSLRVFDIVGFSLQYEEDYLKMVDMLKRSNIPLKKEDRTKEDPLIIAGGPCATSNPLPISEFIDLFMIGEAECILDDFIDVFKDTNNPQADIYDFLEIPGIYIPGHKVKIQKIKSMDKAYRPIYQIVTKTDNPKYQPAFKDSFLLEVSRGCSRGCRFCMAGCMYRPRRETKLKDLIEIAHQTRQVTGKNKVALIGGAVSDYSQIEDLCQQLYEDNFKIATPSLRIETVTPELIDILKTSGLKTITLAPESIQKLRYSMNKPITDSDIINTIDYAMQLKLKIKLYLLIGIPNETKEDLLELVNFLREIMGHSIGYNPIKTSVNPLIPKPHTPLQWTNFDYLDLSDKMQKYGPRLKYKTKNNNVKKALIQYILSNGGTNLNKIMAMADKIHFKDWYKIGQKLNKEKLKPSYELPWKEIDVGIKTSYLKKESEKILKNEITPWCETNNCTNCGSCK